MSKGSKFFEGGPVHRYGRIKLNKETQENNSAPLFSSPVKISFLGGLDEIGKNMTVYEYNGEMIIVDCGMGFPDASMPGVDIVIPDFSYVLKNSQNVSAVFITHGHEDHIGGLSFLLKHISVPVYGSGLTLGLIEHKLEEADIPNPDLREISPGDVVHTRQFYVEAIHVNHSIPTSLAYAVTCDDGTIIHTGDYKIDPTPIDGEMTDLARFGDIGNAGVLALLSDSTNAERPGFTPSERTVGDSFRNLFLKAGKKRIIVATFASNIHRVQQIMNVAAEHDRKVALSGRSLENVVEVSRRLGYLNVPDGLLIDIDMIRGYPDDQIVIITTGSQGEPMSALARMANNEHRRVTITPNDYVIISAKPIPGNERTIGNVINELIRSGAEVVYESMYDVHVSGHACQEEQKIIIGLAKPRFFIPVHGEVKQLSKHAASAREMGIPADRIIVPSNGTCISFLAEDTAVTTDVPAGNILIDGSGVGDIGNAVLKERQRLSTDGVVIISVVVDLVSGFAASSPVIDTKGFIYMKESESLLNGAEEVVEDVLEGFSRQKRHDPAILADRLRDEMIHYIREKTRRTPVVVPIVHEI